MVRLGLGWRQDPAKSHDLRAAVIQFWRLVPGLRPVSLKGIQAGLALLEPSPDRTRPALAKEQGWGLTGTPL